ncbi:MAG TPA: type IV secretion system protein [Steroidobacteraceae bacterium]|nr:type IV secretion system protein [Steroidobacteraceae bacterium]
MGFFAEFNTWLNGLLTGYIADNVARIAAALEPAIVTLGVLYVMVWGYLELTGQIEEPFVTGVKRIVTLAVILGCALSLWLYNSVIVDTFFNAPAELGAVVVGAFDPVGVIDQIIFVGGDAANLLLQQGGLLEGNFAYYLAGIGVYLVVGLTAIYTIFLLALSRIALSVLLALGPLFIALLLFNTTKRFLEAWIAQLANYAFIAVLAVLVAALMLRVVTVAASQAVSEGGSIDIASAVRVCMAAGLTFLVMRQVMPMAAGLASGLALSSFGVVSAAVAWGLGGALRGSGQFARGLADGATSRTDPLPRLAGQQLRSGVMRIASTRWRDNEVRRRA